MSRKGVKGVGSNQYADKAPSPTESEAENVRVRKMKNYTSVQSKQSALGGRLEHHSTAALATGLSSSLDKRIKSVVTGQKLSQDEILSSAKEISAYEDAILSRHPNLYGHAVSEAILFVKDAKYNPELKKAVEREDSPERVLLQNYSKVIGDAIEAPGKEISLEELPQILDTINEASIARGQGTTWQSGRSGEPTLSSQFAALSVFCSRDPENSSLQHRMMDLRNQINKRGMEKIDM